MVSTVSSKISNQPVTFGDECLDTISKVVQKGLELIQILIIFISNILTLASRKVSKIEEKPSEGATDISPPDVRESTANTRTISTQTDRDRQLDKLFKIPTVSVETQTDIEALNLLGDDQQGVAGGEELPVTEESDDVQSVVQVSLTDVQKGAIKNLIEIGAAPVPTGVLGKLKAAPKLLKVKEETAKIKGLHPLQFLLEVFTSSRTQIVSIFSKPANRNSFLHSHTLVKSITNGFANDMNEKAQEADFQGHLKIFIASIYLEDKQRTEHEPLLREHAEQKNWEGFIRYLIDNPNS